MKSFFIGLVVGCVLSVVVWLLLPNSSAEKIKKAEQELTEYKNKYDATKHTADSLDSVVGTLQNTKEKYIAAIDSMKGVITVLEKQQKQDFFRIAAMFEPDSLIDQVKVMFPKFRNTPMGLIEVKAPRTGIEVTCYYLPVQLVSSFIEDRQELMKVKEEKAVMTKINLTYESYVALQDTIISLKEQKAQEYQRGFEYGLKKYEALTKDYMEELKTPKLNFGLPTLGTMIGSAAVGYIIGRELHKNP